MAGNTLYQSVLTGELTQVGFFNLQTLRFLMFMTGYGNTIHEGRKYKRKYLCGQSFLAQFQNTKFSIPVWPPKKKKNQGKTLSQNKRRWQFLK